MADPTRKLFFGDNLEIMREHVAPESVDLVYLDPPFNSNQTYNVLFKTDDARPSQAQMEAFDDTWHWTPDTEAEWQRLVLGNDYFVPSNLSKGMDALRLMLGENDVMAYLVMMTPRLLEIHRALKDTGSMYLHCDPTASHYLKLICDQVFEPRNFRSEIIWKRTGAHGATKGYAPVHDVILYYARSKAAVQWNQTYLPYSAEYLETKYRYEDDNGRYRLISVPCGNEWWRYGQALAGNRPHGQRRPLEIQTRQVGAARRRGHALLGQARQRTSPAKALPRSVSGRAGSRHLD